MEKFAMNNALGRHLLVEFYNCDAAVLDDVDRVESIMNQAAVACGATIVQSTFHRFEPYGVSGVVVIAESHLAVHTWPEYRFASVDLYTCGDSCDPMIAYTVLKSKLKAGSADIQKINRGFMDRIAGKTPEVRIHAAMMAEKEGVAL
jgi:S-adenosylmethionine decarboxylase proenzyme